MQLTPANSNKQISALHIATWEQRWFSEESTGPVLSRMIQSYSFLQMLDNSFT